MQKKIYGPFSNILNIQNCFLTILIIGIVFSTINLIFLRHKSRLLFYELEKLSQERDKLHIAWSQLLLEKGTLSAGIQIENIAEKKLAMKLPDLKDEQKV